MRAGNCLTWILRMLLIFLCGFAFAQTAPDKGILYHTTEGSSITYYCNPHGQELQCEMTQTFVRQALKPEDIPKKRKEMLEQLIKTENDASEFAKQCSGWHEMKEMVSKALNKNERKKLPKEVQEKILKMKKAEITWIKQMTDVFVKYCDAPNSATRQAANDFIVNDEVSTCRVGSHHWKEVFVKAKGIEAMNIGEANAWVAKSEPTGACGAIQLNRFEPEEVSGKLVFWNYIARKAITNPKGMNLLGKCDGWDEGIYKYSWMSRDLMTDCRKIKFSVY